MNYPVLVFKDEAARDHWMVDRLFRRAGFVHTEFTKLVADSTVLDELNRGVHTKVIVFGEDALYTVLGKTDIERWFNTTNVLQLKDKQLLVFPCLDPQRLLARKQEEPEEGKRKKKGMRHPPRYQGGVMQLLKKVVNHTGVHSITTTEYVQDPSPQSFGRWVDRFYEEARIDHTFLSWDIETPYKIKEDDEEEWEEEKRKLEKTVIRISASYKPGHAVSVPNLPEYWPYIKRLLLYKGYHIGWNAVAFDVPIMEYNGAEVGGVMLDGMDAFHMWQSDWDKGLEKATAMLTDILPWKHLSDTLPALYSCIDSDAALRCVLRLKEILTAQGLWERFLKEMKIIKLLNDAGKRGNLVDNDFRLEMKRELEAMLYTKLLEAQDLVSVGMRKHKLYKRLPKGEDPQEWATHVQTVKVSQCSFCGKQRVSTKHKCLGDWAKTEVEIPHVHYYLKNPLSRVHTLEDLQEYLSHSGFNPGSHDQMKKYMKAHRHPVGKNHKTDKDSADVRHLWALVRKYGNKFPIYRHTIEIRKIQKALSTYVNGLEPDDNGLMHTTYVNSPSSWRLGSRNRNVQNLGKGNENPYATRARKIIIPSKDRVLITADSSAIEAVMVGKFMESDHYINEARKGIHAGLCCKWLKWPVTDENRKRVKKEEKDLYDRLKKMNHATNFGMGPYLAYMTYPEYFPTLADAKKMQNFIYAELPMLKTWHHQLRLVAQKNGFLDNPWGMRFYFYDVFTYAHDDDGELIVDEDGLPKIKLGKDGKRVIAIKPQSSAAMFMRDNTYLIGQTEAREWMPAVFSIHDGYTLDVPYARQDTAINILGDILTRPIVEMDNLRVGCEIEIGHKNFLEMEPIKEIKIEV